MSRYIKIDDLEQYSLSQVINGIINIQKLKTADVVENKVLRLLLDWAIECGFGYDSIPEEYEKYKHDIQDMSYTGGLIYIAMKEVDDEQIH